MEVDPPTEIEEHDSSEADPSRLPPTDLGGGTSEVRFFLSILAAVSTEVFGNLNHCRLSCLKFPFVSKS